MEDDYLPLYEVVDHKENKDHSNVDKSSGYQKLMVTEGHTNSVQDEYDLPQSDTRYVHYRAYSEVPLEIQSLKRNSRRLKLLFSIGGIIIFVLLIIVVCTFTATWMRFGRNLVHVQNSLLEQIHDVQEGSSTEQTDRDQHKLAYHGSLRNCSQESTSCNFKSNSSDWLYCDTSNLRMHKKNYVTVDIRCNHNFDPIQKSVLASSLEVVNGNSEIFCRCSIVHPTSIGHSRLPPPNVTPNCILVVMRCPVF